jgi:hypothetical protein
MSIVELPGAGAFDMDSMEANRTIRFSCHFVPEDINWSEALVYIGLLISFHVQNSPLGPISVDSLRLESYVHSEEAAQNMIKRRGSLVTELRTFTE